MLVAHRIQLLPVNKAKTYFAKACGVARFGWNWGVAEWDRRYRTGAQAQRPGLEKGIRCANRCREVLQAARYRQTIQEFRAQYAMRAGIESTHEQAIRRCGLRRSRYIGLAKTHLQQIITAIALNFIRLGEWWNGTPLAPTRVSRFAQAA